MSIDPATLSYTGLGGLTSDNSKISVQVLIPNIGVCHLTLYAYLTTSKMQVILSMGQLSFMSCTSGIAAMQVHQGPMLLHLVGMEMNVQGMLTNLV